MSKITKKQMNVLTAIIEYLDSHGYPPSYRELAGLVNLVSASTVKGHLESLKKKGFVTWEVGRPRTLQIIEQQKSSAS